MRLCSGEFLTFFSRANHGRRTGVRRRQRGTKMAAADRFSVRFSPAKARNSASSRGHKAKMRGVSRPIQIQKFEPLSRVNSCAIPSRVETNVPRYGFVTLRTACDVFEYHYCSINTERRNSENCWSYCGNPTPSISTYVRISLKNKHLDLFQNGPPLAKYVPPARVHMYWCPDI